MNKSAILIERQNNGQLAVKRNSAGHVIRMRVASSTSHGVYLYDNGKEPSTAEWFSTNLASRRYARVS
jgi:hypothetical protein